MIDSGICYQDTSSVTVLHYVTLYRGSTHLAPTASGFTGAYYYQMTYNDIGYSMSMTYLDSPSSTASQTYTTYHRNGGAATAVCKYMYGGSSGAMTLMEIGV